MNKLIKRFLREDRGVTAIEYALIAGLMAAAVATAITGVTGKITAVFTAVVNSM
ncbi:Flp family type IVb pilin [Trinickia dinghuensis]|uniref:Flp family type IVb pilin n=1 Tax=Trinickia dinghuensis TaxID=2291023 RepID=A0A3D8JYN3_9BURK|nr:Flp family type IVb pilin [Trinickia dinghuensis]RDU97481.1 Flp family type IVb pilin [Trinickia dinghuensis]